MCLECADKWQHLVPERQFSDTPALMIIPNHNLQQDMLTTVTVP